MAFGGQYVLIYLAIFVMQAFYNTAACHVACNFFNSNPTISVCTKKENIHIYILYFFVVIFVNVE